MDKSLAEINAELEATRFVLFTLIEWMVREIGVAGVEQLEKLYEKKKAEHLTGAAQD